MGFQNRANASSTRTSIVAPPDHHLLLAATAIQVLHGPRENGFSPGRRSTVSLGCQRIGGRVVGLILSGALDDGTFGLMAVKRAGGITIVQHPYEALVPSMPLSAIQNVEVDHTPHWENKPAARFRRRQRPECAGPQRGIERASITFPKKSPRNDCVADNRDELREAAKKLAIEWHSELNFEE